MNERMYELINESFIGTTDGKLSPINTVANIEKFAELIIRECLDVLNPDNDHLTSMREEYGRKMSMRLIEQHFGIE